MTLDWVQKLRHLLQTLAFCLAVSAIQYAFIPERPYEVPMLYSLCIGTSTWALIDFGRHLFPSARATGWPTGVSGLLLPLGGMVLGYGMGTLAADTWFGWSSWSGVGLTQLRASIIVTVLAGIAGIYFFYSRNRSTYLEARMAEARLQATDARLKLLETQLEPHMLFNTLANLRALIGSDPQRATAMLDRIIAYLRATLSASRAGTHSLGAEFERLRDYLELMAVRMGPRLRYTLTLPPELSNCPVPALLLQPLVENSLQHGLEPKVDGGSIAVQARLDGGTLRLEVIDTGVGLSEAAPGTGFGLAQVRERLATAYGARGSIQLLANDAGGSRATITLPYPA
jgi:signal transduction histidine kinase